MISSTRAVGMLAIGILFCTVSCAGYGSAPEKKLVYFGWDMLSPSDLAGKIDELQDLPFDGLAIRTAWCYPFYSTGLPAPDGAVEVVKKIEWGRFTDNFIYMTAGKKVDWFDDELWADDGDIMRNIRALARIGAAAGCKGIIFDPEFVYWGQQHNTWKYEDQARAKEKTFAEFEAIVRRRGVKVINAIEEYMPNTNFLSLFWGSMGRFAEAGRKHDPKLAREIMEEDYYGLLNAFMCGILEGADPGTRIIDGNEHSYYNNRAEQYLEARRLIKEEVVSVLIPPDLRGKYRRQVECAHAIYSDNICNTFYQHSLSTYMSPEERTRWMEHNVYWALKTADRYVWFYSERIPYMRHQRIPPGIIAAIERAKKKVASGEELGFDVAAIADRAWAAYCAAESGAIPTARADVPKRKGAISIDGRLDDPGWRNAARLEPFRQFRTAVGELYGRTEARITYDDRALYIGVVCDEPDKILHPTPFATDGHDFGKNDQVDFVFAADDPVTKFYHIMVTTDGKTWDSLTKAAAESYGDDASWSGDYSVAVRVAEDKSRYTVEIAVPWKSIGRDAPRPGDVLKGNVYRWRHRNAEGFIEMSSWSRSRRRRAVEAKQFGTWVFTR